MVTTCASGSFGKAYADRGTTNHDYLRVHQTWILQRRRERRYLPYRHHQRPGAQRGGRSNRVRGRHTIQVGANYRAIYNNRTTDSTAYKYANVNYNYLTVGSIAGTGSSLDPGAFGFPAVDASFKTAYNSADCGCHGLITHAWCMFLNYGVSGNTSRRWPPAALTKRHYL